MLEHPEAFLQTEHDTGACLMVTLYPAAVEKVSHLRSGHGTPSRKLQKLLHTMAPHISIPCWSDAALTPWSTDLNS